MKTAIIFAAGAGTRLDPLTRTVHKSLIKIDNLPLIEYLIKNLLTLKTLREIIIITGYKQNDFAYLAQNYSKVKLIVNSYFYQYESAYVLTLLPKAVFNDDLFFISGDFIMKENCFSDEITENVMAAMKRVNTKKDWSYQLNKQGQIIGLVKDTNIKSLLASEWSHINHKWSKKLKTRIENKAEIETLKTTMIGQYLINQSIKDKISLKPYLLSYNSFWDLDDEHDLARIKKYYHT